MKRIKNKIIKKASILLDAFYEENGQEKPVLIFSHGFKGYKDWGAWNLMAEAFAKAGFVFVKFNFSHNGGTLEDPIDFPDLEKFGENTFSQEAADLEEVITFLLAGEILPLSEINTEKIHLLAHSRGGVASVVTAAKDRRVKKIATLSSVAYSGERLSGFDKKEWKSKGVVYITNGRTKQQMPLNYTLYQDWLDNKEALNLVNRSKDLLCPFLVIQAGKDETVSVEEGKLLADSPQGKYVEVAGANHTFGAKHPWESKELPIHLAEAIKLLLEFYRS